MVRMNNPVTRILHAVAVALSFTSFSTVTIADEPPPSGMNSRPPEMYVLYSYWERSTEPKLVQIEIHADGTGIHIERSGFCAISKPKFSVERKEWNRLVELIHDGRFFDLSPELDELPRATLITDGILGAQGDEITVRFADHIKHVRFSDAVAAVPPVAAELVWTIRELAGISETIDEQ